MRADLTFAPAMAAAQREHAMRQWHRAVERAKGWVEA
jgi:glycerol kinase